MSSDLEHLTNLYDRVEYLQNLLIDMATGGAPSNVHYQAIRQEILDAQTVSHLVPRWVRVNRSLAQFWQFIKNEFGTYAERRTFIWNEFSPLLGYLETGATHPAQASIQDALKKFDSEGIQFAWNKALSRKQSDPEGAITISRTIVESVCKHILDEEGVDYDSSSIELSELYKLVAKQLNLAPEQHLEPIFKQILGGCSGVVSGLGALRNKLGDAHGKGKAGVKPQARHAELAVNLAGSIAIFLIATYEAKKT